MICWILYQAPIFSGDIYPTFFRFINRRNALFRASFPQSYQPSARPSFLRSLHHRAGNNTPNFGESVVPSRTWPSASDILQPSFAWKVCGRITTATDNPWKLRPWKEIPWNRIQYSTPRLKGCKPVTTGTSWMIWSNLIWWDLCGRIRFFPSLCQAKKHTELPVLGGVRLTSLGTLSILEYIGKSNTMRIFLDIMWYLILDRHPLYLLCWTRPDNGQQQMDATKPLRSKLVMHLSRAIGAKEMTCTQCTQLVLVLLNHKVRGSQIYTWNLC